MRDFYSAPSGQSFAVFDQEAVLVETGFPTRDEADDRVVELLEHEDRLTTVDGRDANLTVIAEHHGHHATDERLMARVFRRLGWRMLTAEALAILAHEYEIHAQTRERMDAENRALAAARRP